MLTKCVAVSLTRGAASEADVAADHDVAAGDARGEVLVDGVRDDGGGHGELDGRGVDDADDVARAGRLEDREEGPVAAVLGVELDDLFVVSEVRTTGDKTRHTINHAMNIMEEVSR